MVNVSNIYYAVKKKNLHFTRAIFVILRIFSLWLVWIPFLLLFNYEKKSHNNREKNKHICSRYSQIHVILTHSGNLFQIKSIKIRKFYWIIMKTFQWNSLQTSVPYVINAMISREILKVGHIYFKIALNIRYIFSNVSNIITDQKRCRISITF